MSESRFIPMHKEKKTNLKRRKSHKFLQVHRTCLEWHLLTSNASSVSELAEPRLKQA